MSCKCISRRSFLKGVLATTATLTFGCKFVSPITYPTFDPKGIPTRTLGRTGIQVPLIGIGTGSRFCSVYDEDKALEILNYALDHGLYYWDTAHNYGNDKVISEERVGKILKNRREEVFLATKVRARNADEAKRHIEKSLKRLQTDYVDILQVHSIKSLEDAKEVVKKGGVLDLVRGLKVQGVAKFIGFTGHSSTEAMGFLAKDYEFDTMLIALNHFSTGQENFEKHAVPIASEKGLGIMVMKVIRPREMIKSLSSTDLINYSLSLKQAHVAVLGIDSMDVLKQNIALLKDFKPLNARKVEKIRLLLSPFFRHENVAWMRPDYRDGLLV
jgi:aryl-alcohol dehydrogenase-like predicted oxidoreductase